MDEGGAGELRVLLAEPLLGRAPAAEGPDAAGAVLGGEVGQGVAAAGGRPPGRPGPPGGAAGAGRGRAPTRRASRSTAARCASSASASSAIPDTGATEETVQTAVSRAP